MSENLPVPVDEAQPDADERALVDAPPTAVQAPALDQAAVDDAFKRMALWDEGADEKWTDALRQKWGASAAANLQFAQAFAQAHPDISDLLTSKDLGDHPVLIEVAAILGRRYAAAAGDPSRITTKQGSQAVEQPINTQEWDARIDGLETQAKEQHAKGNYRRADALYQQKLQAIARRDAGKAARRDADTWTR